MTVSLRKRALRIERPAPPAKTAVEELNEYERWREQEQREAMTRFYAAWNPRDEKLQRLMLKAAVEVAVETLERELRDQVEEKRVEAERLAGRASDLGAQAAELAVDEGEIVARELLATECDDEVARLTTAIGNAIAAGDTEQDGLGLEALRNAKTAACQRYLEELDVLGGNAAQAAALRADADVLQEQAAALQREADEVELRIPDVLVEERPKLAVTLRRQVRERAELASRAPLEQTIHDSANEVLNEIRVVGGIKSIEIPLS
jgi:hypothetical protein